MIRNDDIIRDILARVLECLRTAGDGTFSEQVTTQIMEIEPAARQDWGGEQIKIAKRAPQLRDAREKVRAEIGIKSMEEIRSEHTGVSRRTLYRWVTKQPKKPAE